MQLKEAEAVLAGVGWLSSQPKDIRARLFSAAQIRTLSPGDTIYALDDPPGGLYGIADGFVDVLVAPGPFPVRLVHVGIPGWWTGEAAAATRTNRRAEVKARTAVSLVYMSGPAIERLSSDFPMLWRHLATLTVQHLDIAMLYAGSFASVDLKLRLLTTLLRLLAPTLGEEVSVKLPIGQADLAELSGLSRNTVSRIIATLAKEGCVKPQYGSLLVDVTRLQAVTTVAASAA